MKNIVFQNIVHIDNNIENHVFFYDALQQVTNTSNYWTFVDAKDALNTLVSKKITPDIIFLDLEFPKMSGQEFLARLKKHEHLCNIPVIVFSSSTSRSIIQVTRILGAKAFVTKPTSLRQLIKILWSILSLEFLMTPQAMLSSFANFNQHDLGDTISEDLFWSDVTEHGFHMN